MHESLLPYCAVQGATDPWFYGLLCPQSQKPKSYTTSLRVMTFLVTGTFRSRQSSWMIYSFQYKPTRFVFFVRIRLGYWEKDLFSSNGCPNSSSVAILQSPPHWLTFTVSLMNQIWFFTYRCLKRVLPKAGASASWKRHRVRYATFTTLGHF